MKLLCDGHEYIYKQDGEEHQLLNNSGFHVATAYYIGEHWAIELEAQPAHEIEARYLGQFHENEVDDLPALLVGQYAAATS